MNDRFKFRAWNVIVNRYKYFDFNSLAKMDNDTIQWHILKFEQCTGLKDKNGTLIYEGDIVDILCEVEEQGFIEWSPEEAQFVVIAEQAGFVANFDNYRGTDLEVIGNIHEKPELMEVK